MDLSVIDFTLHACLTTRHAVKASHPHKFKHITFHYPVQLSQCVAYGNFSWTLQAKRFLRVHFGYDIGLEPTAFGTTIQRSAN